MQASDFLDNGDPFFNLDDDDNEYHDGEVEPLPPEAQMHVDNSFKTAGGPLARTTLFMSHLSTLTNADIALKMASIIEHMASLQMDVTTFLHFLSWNLKVPVDMKHEEGTIRYARTALMHSEQLPGILKNWHKPPRPHSWGVRTTAARNAMDDWALENVTARINREMRLFAPQLLSPPQDITEESLLATRLKDDIPAMQATQPTFWKLMHSLSCTPLQAKRNKYKSHEPRIFIIGAMLHYGRSHHRCRYQKFLSIYLKASGLAAKANDTTHLFGLTMSQKWIYKGIEQLSDSNRQRMMDDIIRYLWFGGHDNLNLAFKIYEQRANKQSHFDNGTAGTIYIVKDTSVPPPNRIAYMEQRARECKNPITALEIFLKARHFGPRLYEQRIHIVLSILLEAPEFTDWEHKADAALACPTPVQQLPIGLEHATVQHVLDTVHMEEGTQEGNRQVIDEWKRQLGLTDVKARQEPMANRLIVWVGDQLTTIQLRFVKRDRVFDLNFIQRFEQFLEIFGWFHAQIAQEFSMHKQYLGSSENLGLKHAFENLNRKGLNTTSVQGNFHYTFREALRHTAEARFRDVWTVAAGVEELAELRQRTPQELRDLACKVVDEYASTEALVKLRQPDKSRSAQDDLFDLSVQFNRDTLDFLDLDDCIRTGDVGRMEYLLPRLLFRFHGGGNHKYAHELLELMQGLWREWPDDLKSFVMRFCWLANTTGKKNSFLAFDMVQEHNIRDIKVTFATLGPYATWDYIKRMSASIPTQRKIKHHVEREFNHFCRGLSHTSPSHHEDVVKLQGKYHEAKAHVFKPGRHLTSNNKVKDVMALGSNPKTLQAMIDRWTERRLTEKSDKEIFDDVDTLVQRYKDSMSVRANKTHTEPSTSVAQN
ncbi:hypothetical protein BC835DRAFT_1420806 [Cytidiella melzeri]|nr:hypothetical protein BC835DRAFT_1420806 [Cytidiella melzeri]